MKMSIIVVHVFLGLLLIFFNVNNLLHLTNLTAQASTDQYYYGVPLRWGYIEAALGTILGLVSVAGAFALRKERKWAWFALPIVTLAVVVVMLRSLMSASGFVGGPIVLVVLVLVAFLVSEILFIILKRPV